MMDCMHDLYVGECHRAYGRATGVGRMSAAGPDGRLSCLDRF